jgi:hypothetical protein
LAASLSLLTFAVLTTLAIVAWFSRAEQPWNWKAVVAMLAAMLGLTTSALVWRAPSRTHVVAGIVVMGLSLLRVGPPSDWTWVSFALLSVTVLLLVPLVNAAIVLRYSPAENPGFVIDYLSERVKVTNAILGLLLIISWHAAFAAHAAQQSRHLGVELAQQFFQIRRAPVVVLTPLRIIQSHNSSLILFSLIFTCCGNLTRGLCFRQSQPQPFQTRTTFCTQKNAGDSTIFITFHTGWNIQQVYFIKHLHLQNFRRSNLAIISTPNQDNPAMEGRHAVLGVDVWEHAYYLKYQNRRADYLAAWWSAVNWAAVKKRFSG